LQGFSDSSILAHITKINDFLRTQVQEYMKMLFDRGIFFLAKFTNRIFRFTPKISAYEMIKSRYNRTSSIE